MIILNSIFARGNSKGIKNKNLLKFKNKSLVGHAVIKLTNRNLSKKYMSSKSKKIINEAKK